MGDDLKDKLSELLGQFGNLKDVLSGGGFETKEEPKKEDMGFKPESKPEPEPEPITDRAKLEDLEDRIRVVEDYVAGFVKILKR